MIARGFPPASEEGKYIPLDFRPSYSSNEPIFYTPVFTRRLLTSGEIFGLVLANARHTAHSIITAIPNAIMGIEFSSRNAVGTRPNPTASRPNPK